MRHLTWKIPFGQSVAREMGAVELSSADLSELQSIEPRTQSTPLFY